MADTYFGQNSEGYGYHEEAQDVERVERSRFLEGKVRIIFILSILQIVCNILSNVSIPTGMYRMIQIITVLVGVTYGIILLVMSKKSNHFKIAGICNIAVPIVTVASVFTYNVTIIYFVAVVMIVVGFVAMCQEMYGFSETLSGINNALSMKWSELWRLLMTWLVVLFVSLIVFMVIPILGGIGMIVALIAVIVVSVLRLVCIVDTANAFENYVRLHQ